MTDAATLALALAVLGVGAASAAWEAHRRGLTVRDWWDSLR